MLPTASVRRHLLSAHFARHARSASPHAPVSARLCAGTQLLDALLAGANPNLRDPNGRTGLHFMCGIGLAPACVLLIHFGADVDARDNAGLAPVSAGAA